MELTPSTKSSRGMRGAIHGTAHGTDITRHARGGLVVHEQHAPGSRATASARNAASTCSGDAPSPHGRFDHIDVIAEARAVWM